MRIAIGSEHTGFEMRKVLIVFLGEQGHEVKEVGVNSTVPSNHPDFFEAVELIMLGAKANARYAPIRFPVFAPGNPMTHIPPTRVCSMAKPTCWEHR